MKIFLAVAVALLIGAALFFYFPSTGKDEEVQGTSIQFYPRANIYYDVDNDVYYLLSNDKWERVKKLTEEQAAFLGPHVMIERPAAPVWLQNEHHKLVYATELYTSASDYRKKYIEDSLSSLPKKPPVIVVAKDSASGEQAERKRSGVRSFFDRLFKKRSKADRDTGQ
jgi:hypothetical protein